METASPYNITPESIAQELERLCNKGGHDEAQALYHAEQGGHAEGCAKVILLNK